MKDKLKKYLKEIVIFVVLLVVGANALSYYRSLELNNEKLNIDSFKLLDNSKYTVPKGKPLVIYFWATWCPICKFQSPNIEKLSKDYEVITIATQSGSKKQIQEYLDKHKLSFKVVEDQAGFYARSFNIKVVPTTIIYNKDKIISFSDVGYTSTWGLYLRMLFSF